MQVTPIIIELDNTGTVIEKDSQITLEAYYGTKRVDMITDIVRKYKGEHKRVELLNYLNTIQTGKQFLVTYKTTDKKVSLDYGQTVSLVHNQLFIVEIQW